MAVNSMLAKKVNSCLKNIQNTLFPGVCLLCGDACVTSLSLCEGCLADLPYPHSCCHRCAAPLPVAGVCGQCLRHPPAFERVVSLFDYLPPVDSLILGLKFHGKLAGARLLGDLLAEQLKHSVAHLPECIIPVPLHPVRLRSRGYNQVLEVARPLSRVLGLPLDARSCRRLVATAEQSSLDVRARRRNVQGVFSVAANLGARHVAIVDDVMTTGNTVQALSRALLASGVARVDVWVCARAILAPP